MEVKRWRARTHGSFDGGLCRCTKKIPVFMDEILDLVGDENRGGVGVVIIKDQAGHILTHLLVQKINELQTRHVYLCAVYSSN
mgnify:CR=1 FL=1